MKNFRSLTTGNVVVMGRKTLESMPGGLPLPNRETWVLTRNEDYEAPCQIFHTLQALLDVVRTDEAEYGEGGFTVYVCGGANVYRQLLPYCDEAYITKIDYDYQADAYFPCLDDDDEWECVSVSEEETYWDLEYRFCIYRRKKPGKKEE